MTVSTATATASYTGNGSTQIFPIPFYFFDDGDLKVSKWTADTEVTTVLTLGSDYTVSDAGNPQGGSVTLLSAPAAGDKIFIERNLSAVQQTAYPVNGPFPSASHEQALDRLTMLVQQLRTADEFTLLRDPLGDIYDAQNGRIVNVLDGASNTDAATVGQVTQAIAAAQITPAVPAADVALYSALGATGGAADIGFDDTTAGLGASDVQAAIAKLATRVNPNNDVAKVIRKIKDGQTVKIVCLGDSITWGYRPDGSQATKPYPIRLQSLLQQYYANSNVTVVNAGVPGDTVGAMIARYATDVAAQSPDLIIFNGGTNDAREANNVDLATYLANVLQVLKLAGTTPVVIMGITPRFKEQMSGDGEGVIDFYRQTLKRVAEYYRLPYIDTFTRLHNLYKSGGFRSGTLSTDGSHYTDDGYVLLGEAIFVDGFVNDNLTIKPGQFKDMRGQWLITAAADSTWGGSDAVDGNTITIAASATVRLYLYVEDWQNAALVLHGCVDNTNGTGQAISVQNQSITSGGVVSGPTRTFNLSQKTNASATVGFLNDYPFPTVKLRPGLNNLLLTASSAGARLCGLSVIAVGDHGYAAPYVNNSHGGSGEAQFGSSFNQSTQAYSALNPGAPVVVGNNNTYIQPYFYLLPDYDGNTTRWRFRGLISPSTAFYFGQQQSGTLGVSYAYKLSFDGTNAKVEIRTHSGTLQTCATTALAVSGTGADVTVDVSTSPTGWSVWVNGTLIYSDTIPLSMGQVYAGTTSATVRTYLNPPLKKGPNDSDTGALIGESYISFADGKLHFVTTGGTDKSVAFA